MERPAFMTHMNKIKAIIAHNEITDSPQKNKHNKVMIVTDHLRKEKA